MGGQLRWKRAAAVDRFRRRVGRSSAWSPDGHEIAFHLSRDGNYDIYSVAAEGGHIRRLTHDSSIDSSPEWSSDGESIYFASDRSGQSEIWKQPAAGDAAVQMTSGGAYEPRLIFWKVAVLCAKRRSAGRLLGNSWRVVPHSLSRWRCRADPAGSGHRPLECHHQGHSVRCRKGPGVPLAPEVHLVPLAGGRPSLMEKLPVPNMVLSASASVAGDRLVIALLESATEDLMLLRGLR